MKAIIKLEWHPVEEELPKGCDSNLYVTARDNETGELILWKAVNYDDRDRYGKGFYWTYDFHIVPLEPEYTVLAWANEPHIPLYIPKEDRNNANR